MTTTDAEAIALDTALRMFNAELERWLDSSDARLKDFTPLAQWQRVVSLLASRREAQEPVDWIYEDELPSSYPYGRMFAYSKVRDGVRMFPVYAPSPSPAPAGEVERLRGALKKIKSLLSFANQNIVTPAARQSNINSAWWQADAALNGVRHDQ